MPTTKNSTADEVLAALKQYPGSTAAELAEAAGLGRSTAGKCPRHPGAERQGPTSSPEGGRAAGGSPTAGRSPPPPQRARSPPAGSVAASSARW